MLCRFLAVSILGLVEEGLEVSLIELLLGISKVSILGLVEEGLEEESRKQVPPPRARFNPWFSGRGLRRRSVSGRWRGK